MILFFLMFSFCLNAQSFERDKLYIFTKGTTVNHYSKKESRIITDKSEIAQSGWKFKIDEKIKDGYVIRFQEWDSEKKNKDLDERIIFHFVYNYISVKVVNKEGKENETTKSEPLYLFVDSVTFENSIIELEGETPMISFVSGVLTVPIKIRPRSDDRNHESGNLIRPVDFSNEINIGLFDGVKIRIDNKKRAYLNVLGGLSLTSIPVDAETPNDF